MSISVVAIAAPNAPESSGKLSDSTNADAPAENIFQALFANLLAPQALPDQGVAPDLPSQNTPPDAQLIADATLATAQVASALPPDAAALAAADASDILTVLADQQAPGPVPASDPALIAPGVATVPPYAPVASATVSDLIRPPRAGEKPSLPGASSREGDIAAANNAFEEQDRKSGATESGNTARFENKVALAAMSEISAAVIGEKPVAAFAEVPQAHAADNQISPLGSTENAARGALPASIQPQIRELELKAHPSSPVWREGFSAQINVLVGERVQSAQMRLNPPELGPVEIRIFNVDQQTSIVFTAAHEETRRAIEDSLPRLREVLAESGVNLEGASVNRERHSGESHRQAHGEAGRPVLESNVDEDEAEAVMAAPRRGAGLIDTFA